MTPTQVAIHGAAGRMGRRLVALGSEDADLVITAAIENPDHPQLGSDAGLIAGVAELGFPLSPDLTVDADVVIDFSVPQGAAAITKTCVERGVALVMATTGLNGQQQAMISAAAQKIPVVWAPSMSLAVNLTMKLAEIAGQALKEHPSGVDVEIVERHHRFKEDAPSGTALRFGQIIAAAMGQTSHVHGREGRPGGRPRDEIAYHAIRVGDNPGEHTVIFGLLGETMELKVSSTSRDCYVQGALAAAKFVAGKDPALYGMNDVLGLA
jgi:4-hydroxy-tetrahydrodipicolinate reductase